MYTISRSKIQLPKSNIRFQGPNTCKLIWYNSCRQHFFSSSATAEFPGSLGDLRSQNRRPPFRLLRGSPGFLRGASRGGRGRLGSWGVPDGIFGPQRREFLGRGAGPRSIADHEPGGSGGVGGPATGGRRTGVLLHQLYLFVSLQHILHLWQQGHTRIGYTVKPR